jgi:pilus assembly protein CpaC
MTAQTASGAPRLLSPARATALLLAVSIAVPQGQMLTGTVARNSDSSGTAAGLIDSDPGEVDLLVGRSAVLNLGQTITRVSLSSPTIADAMVTSQQQLLVHGKAPGSITMFVWDKAGGIRRFEVNVQRDLSVLQHQMKTLFPGEPISVYGNGKDVVINGTVSSKYVVDKAADVAAGYVDKKEDVVNLLKQQEGVATEQVLLRVRFAEVSRTALTELGSSFFGAGVHQNRWFGRTTTQQFAAPTFEQGQDGGTKLVFSDFLNLFLFDNKNGIGGVVRALQDKGLFQSLAEPNLIAENGKEASFLAGGEYPYPVVQGQSGGTSVTIQFKEFGVKLNFTPTIVGQDLVKLKVRPEVSSLDFSNAIVLNGFRVPAISTRRTETEVELQDGQTFAIAGLMNSTVNSQLQKIPGIGDIPILGMLFKSKAAQKAQTELVVMITPQILRRGSTGVSPKLPDIVEPFLAPPAKAQPAPTPWNPAGQPQAQTQPAPVQEQEPARPSPAMRADAPVAAPVPVVIEPPPPARAAASRPRTQPVPAGVSEAPPAAEVPAVEPAQSSKEARAAAARAKKEEKTRAEAAARQADVDRKQAQKLAKEQAKRDAEQAKLEEQRLAQEKRDAAQSAKEQAKLQAELQSRQQEAAKRQAAAEKKQAADAKKQTAEAKKQSEQDRKRAEDLAKAQMKLKEAQEQYQSALDGRSPQR